MDLSLKCLILGAVISLCSAQGNRPRINPQINLLTSIPGFPLNNGTRESKIIIDTYIDLVCPDSAQAFPVLQEVVAAYAPEDLVIYIHQLPLPYHRNGFLLAQGYFQVVEKAPDTVQDFVTMCFANISAFRGSTNKEKSEWDFTQTLAELQEEVTGIPAGQFVRDIDDFGGYTVSTWKYGVRKGVAGTPWFFVNDIDLGVNPSDEMTFEMWTRLIDLLLRFHDSSLTDQEFNLDNYLSTKALQEEDRQVAQQVSRYLREIARNNYFPVHNKQAVNNAKKQPMYTP